MMKRDFSSFLLYGLSFLLLWEWLRPIEKLTNTDNIETFIAFMLITFVMSYFHLKGIWKGSIKLVFILFSINRFYYEQGFFHLKWLKSFLLDVADNIGMLTGRQWNDLSNEFRTLLFFILLWLMVYLIDYWLLNRKQIFIFFFMTLIYITVLDTFTPYSAKAAIVRTVAAGFAVMGMLTFYRIIQKENVTVDSSFIRKWMVPLAGMLAVSVVAGMAAPKAAPIWPDPVPYLTANNNKADGEGSGAGPHRIGYGTNDGALGGPFISDNNPVFKYEASGKSYWKMETKDTYTGKGWFASGSSPISYLKEELVPVYSIPDSVETIKESASVNVHNNYRYHFIMYPAGIQKITDIQPTDPNGNRFMVDTTNERISYYDEELEPVVPRHFTVDFVRPKYKVQDLQRTTSVDPSTFFYQKYTHLPEGLPQRIRELAEEITAEKSNWFDKAKAVESYFSNSGFTYDQKNVAVPGTNDDYVDQFLFDTKRGYCDNFSTSMAVMLRTLGIPTRWVKGYTGGDFLEYSKDNTSKQYYEVTNNNAHSWVEVFFPNQGWVPFEPTKGFTNEILINYEATEGSGTTNQQTIPPPVKKPQKDELEEPKSVEKQDKSFDLKAIWERAKLTAENNWKKAVLILIILTVIAAVVYRIRGKWLPYGVLLVYKFKKKDESIAAAYMVLLNQLERYGIKRKENQTLRNYARYVDTFFSTREMTRLTHFYEQYTYHQNLPKGTWKESHELWENLIKKTIA
ncbi:transglutaminase TgpA family protein [Neobacillus sp. 19]|uniref:transglutaminase TgpA family protein n=1 Tax=Neobacillus sp. 19 TaxID=3394458 RepID=UPI003BF6C796